MVVADYIDDGHHPDPDADADPDPDLDPAPAPVTMTATAQVAGLRLDKALAVLLPHLSRGRTRSWIEAGAVTLNGAPARPRATVLAGDRIDLVEVPSAQEQAFRAEPMALEVVHADPSILVLHKPAGLVVHPAPGHWSGTLLNGLLAYDPALGQLPRAGIVHRLDADTSGLMVVARNAEAQLALVRQLQQRTMTREYWAVVHGTVPPTGTIDAAIGRDRRNPLRFSVAPGSTSKAARTGYRRAGTATFGTTPGSASVSWVVCRLETGRTHQIRVHLESIGHPLVGDRLYRAGRPPVPAAAGKPAPAWSTFPRQALHACRLQLAHPASGEPLGWFAPPPADMTRLMTDLGWRGLDRPQSQVE